VVAIIICVRFWGIQCECVMWLFWGIQCECVMWLFWGIQCECVMWFILRKEYIIVKAPGILEQEETVRFRLSQLPTLFLISIQLLNGTT
jgi:hypothetical protein